MSAANGERWELTWCIRRNRDEVIDAAVTERETAWRAGRPRRKVTAFTQVVRRFYRHRPHAEDMLRELKQRHGDKIAVCLRRCPDRPHTTQTDFLGGWPLQMKPQTEGNGPQGAGG